jgi:adenylate cyclase
VDCALLVDPDNMLLRYNFACALAAPLNDPEAALDMLEQALGPNPGRLASDLVTDPDAICGFTAANACCREGT